MSRIYILICVFSCFFCDIWSQQAPSCENENIEAYGFSSECLKKVNSVCLELNNKNYVKAYTELNSAIYTDSIDEGGMISTFLIELRENLGKYIQKNGQSLGKIPNEEPNKNSNQVSISIPVKEEVRIEIQEVNSNTINNNEKDPIAINLNQLPVALTSDKKEEFEAKCIQKIKLLETYLTQIGSKSVSSIIANQAQINALQLFYLPDSNTVQVNSIKSKSIKTLKIKSYLSKLRLLNYDNVRIEWVDIAFTSDFILAPDGNYHGYAIFQQRFTGNGLDGRKYEDLTSKKIQVVVKAFEKNVDGESITQWDVFLGDISVEE